MSSSPICDRSSSYLPSPLIEIKVWPWKDYNVIWIDLIFKDFGALQDFRLSAEKTVKEATMILLSLPTKNKKCLRINVKLSAAQEALSFIFDCFPEFQGFFLQKIVASAYS